MFRGVFSVPSRCGKPLFLQFSNIVKQDASDNDGSTCHGERRQDFSVEDSHQDWIQDRFHGIDDGSSDRICIPRTDGKQDVGQSDLHASQNKDRGKNRRSENRFPQDHGGKTDAAQKLADHHGGQGISFFKLVEHEHACIEKTGKKRDEISRDPSSGQTVEKEAKDADQNKRNCDDLQPGRLFSEKQKHQKDQPDRHTVLQDDGISGGGQFVGDCEHCRHAGHTHSSHEDSEIELHAVAGKEYVKTDHTGGNQVSDPVDRKGVPGNDFEQNTAQGEAERCAQHHQRAPGVLGPGIGIHGNGSLILIVFCIHICNVQSGIQEQVPLYHVLEKNAMKTGQSPCFCK